MNMLAEQFAALWQSDDSPPDVFAFLERNGSDSNVKLAVLLADQRLRWKTPRPFKVEDYLARLPELAAEKLPLAVGEFKARWDSDTKPIVEEFTIRFADLGELLRSKLSAITSGHGQDFVVHATQTITLPPAVGTNVRIGRFRQVRLLGEGAFGSVWLGVDEDLQRHVAIKVPKAERFEQPEYAEAYLQEARTVAGLDHPHIVPVYEVGRLADGSIFVVSKMIEGSNLADRLTNNRPTFAVAARWSATIAAALYHAHQQRIIHRDVKPANILIDERTDVPYVADFGLAIREETCLLQGVTAGTPAYMSPEQARGEGHRLDGRSDIFALGVVLYEMLTGRRPFSGSTANEVLHQVISLDPKPPRAIDGMIPAELERICLKALSKRASDRYSTAADMAGDLLQWNKRPEQAPRELTVTPKGLRSFDAHDADFFLDLLPGPRTRDGLPEFVQFWKTRIEETDAEKTFKVGLIYGPSGCGKSSLLKAGLLPRLARAITAVYVEATPEETELRMLRGLRKQFPELPADLEIVETFSLLRKQGKKVLVVLDQFEQWLHVHGAEPDMELVNALRHCNGGNLQALVMVRDDFWLAASRFMKSLEIELLEGKTIALVDLFDIDHARKVLIKFGKAFGKLPHRTDEFSDDQLVFVDTVAAGLAQAGKVVSVRLSLFAEMVKGKAWTLETLEQIGGTQGIGVNFLEETFSARTANPKHRLHEAAARGVLKALLPEVGTDIKGHMRSQGELLENSGYASRPAAFNELLRVLDGELRLITPTDPAVSDNTGKQSDSGRDSTNKFYQLTHDYLVPSLREWLTRKQQETRRGRAELKLEERTALWTAKPESQQLPSLLEFLQIRRFVPSKDYTAAQRRMMKAATVCQCRKWSIAAGVVLLFAVVGYEGYGRMQAGALRNELLRADTIQVPGIVENAAFYRRWLDPLLRSAYANAERNHNAQEQLHVGLALLPVDAKQVDYLYDRLLDAQPYEVAVIRDALNDHRSALIAKLWDAAKQPPSGKSRQRLRAAAALAQYNPDNADWERINGAVALDLVSEPAVYLNRWIDILRPVREKLFAPLSTIYRDEKQSEVKCAVAADVLADYSADKPDVLFELLADSQQYQFPVMLAKIGRHREQAIQLAEAEVAKKTAEHATEEQKEALAVRQANAAVMLLHLHATEKVWPLLKHSPDPRTRSYLIHWFASLGVDFAVPVRRLEQESDVSIRRALILSLGEYQPTQVLTAEKESVIARLQELYRQDDDSGLHGAAEWLLRKWGQGERTALIDRKLRQSEKALPENRNFWYINSQGQSFAILECKELSFLMGSPELEPERGPDETLHQVKIGRRFAIAAKEVTKTQWRSFSQTHEDLPQADDARLAAYPKTEDSPMTGMSWFEATWYCNWLSEQEGIPTAQWCYEPNSDGKYASGMKAKENFWELTGYRLPTEAEWEFACRAGSMAVHYFGLNEKLLPQYAYYHTNSENHAWPVGSLKPALCT